MIDDKMKMPHIGFAKSLPGCQTVIYVHLLNFCINLISALMIVIRTNSFYTNLPSAGTQILKLDKRLPITFHNFFITWLSTHTPATQTVSRETNPFMAPVPY